MAKKSIDQVIQQVSETLAQCDEEYIEEIANKVLTHKVKYIGDSVFEQEE